MLLPASCWVARTAGSRRQRRRQNIYFSTSDPGQTKSIAQWGNEVAWVSSDNMRQTIANMGANNISLIATNFYVDQPLQADGTLNPQDKAYIDSQLAVAAKAGNKAFVLGPNVGDSDASYLAGTGRINVSQWAKVIDATKSYINSKGYTVWGVMPFNEPDYWSGQGNGQDLRDVMAQLHAEPGNQSLALEGGSA